MNPDGRLSFFPALIWFRLQCHHLTNLPLCQCAHFFQLDQISLQSSHMCTGGRTENMVIDISFIPFLVPYDRPPGTRTCSLLDTWYFMGWWMKKEWENMAGWPERYCYDDVIQFNFTLIATIWCMYACTDIKKATIDRDSQLRSPISVVTYVRVHTRKWCIWWQITWFERRKYCALFNDLR